MAGDQGITIKGLDETMKRLDETKNASLPRKRAILTEMGSVMLDEVRQQVEEQGVNDTRGDVRSWQEIDIGSGVGYVAVRPIDRQGGKFSGDRSPKNVTRYLERGHGLANGKSGREGSDWADAHPGRGVARQSGTNSSYYYVKAHPFYSWSRLKLRLQLKRYAAEEGKKMLREAAERIAGRGE